MHQDPGRVIKGQKMPGQYGNKRHTTQNLSIIRMHPELNMILVKGAVSGAPQGLIYIQSAAKKGHQGIK